MKKLRPVASGQGRIKTILVTYNQEVTKQMAKPENDKTFLEDYWGGLIKTLAQTRKELNLYVCIIVNLDPNIQQSDIKAILEHSKITIRNIARKYDCRVYLKLIEPKLKFAKIIYELAGIDNFELADTAPKYVQDYVYPLQYKDDEGRGKLILVAPVYNVFSQPSTVYYYVNTNISLQVKNTLLKPTELALMGGNILFGRYGDEDYALVSEDTIIYNDGTFSTNNANEQLNLPINDEQRYKIGQELESTFNLSDNSLYWVPNPMKGTPFLESVLFVHLDTFIAIIGDIKNPDTEARKKILLMHVIDIEYVITIEAGDKFKTIIELPVHLKTIQDNLRKTISDMRSKGFMVIEIPVLLIIDLTNEAGAYVLSYCNCLTEMIGNHVNIFFPSYLPAQKEGDDNKTTDTALIINDMLRYYRNLITIDKQNVQELENVLEGMNKQAVPSIFDVKKNGDTFLSDTIKKTNDTIENIIYERLHEFNISVDCHFISGPFKSSSAEQGGSLHCMTKVLEREYEEDDDTDSK